MFTIPELQSARQLKTLKLLACPHCGEQLNRHARLVVATRNCPACGRRVVAEPEGDGPPPLSREQLAGACAAYARAQNRTAWIALGGFLWLFGSAVFFALYRDTIRAAVQPVIEPGWFFLLVVLGPFAALTGTALVKLGRATRTALPCPHCSAPCAVAAPPFPNLTRFTCNCANCGRKLIDDPPPPEPTASLPTIDEFRSADRRAMRLDWSDWGALLLPVLLFVLYPLLFVLFPAANPTRFHDAWEQRYGVMTAVVLEAVVAAVVISVWVLGSFGIGIVGQRWVGRQRERKRAAEPALNCPHCRAGLLSVPLIVAGRRCPECRARVLADPEPTPVASEG